MPPKARTTGQSEQGHGKSIPPAGASVKAFGICAARHPAGPLWRPGCQGPFDGSRQPACPAAAQTKTAEGTFPGFAQRYTTETPPRKVTTAVGKHEATGPGMRQPVPFLLGSNAQPGLRRWSHCPLTGSARRRFPGRATRQGTGRAKSNLTICPETSCTCGPF